MIQVKQNLNKKEKEIIWSLLQELSDVYKDFYITKNNLRLFIRENLDLLYDCLKKGDRIAFDENLGIILIYDDSDCGASGAWWIGGCERCEKERKS